MDSSALVKLFVEEEESGQVTEAVAGARLVLTHSIAYAEASSAFARIAHLRGQSAVFARLRKGLDEAWRDWEIVAVTDQLVRRAADLAGSHRFKAYDSVHLAGAESMFMTLRQDASFRFAAFDRRLRTAAEKMGMGVLQ